MTVWTDNAATFAQHVETSGLDAHLDAITTEAVELAASHYAAHRPGQALFTLERLRMRLERVEASQEQPRRRHTPLVVTFTTTGRSE